MNLQLAVSSSRKWKYVHNIDIRKITYYTDGTDEIEGGIAIKYSELERMLQDAGCTVLREGKSHTIWYSPKTEKTFTVGRHKTQDVPPGTYKSILRSAGLK